ncbi:MAG: N-6 DNA methylase [Thermodesulfobacteriota bacterium]|nr:N-6 DNA methylase [Thermodesulfobacteriota bacterium]
MTTLSTFHRNILESTVKNARDIAEKAAHASMEQMAVSRKNPFDHLPAEERKLRNRLRARARQLGDKRNQKTKEQGIERLVNECAYEQWHRMLFARFLAKNSLLMHPDGIAVTLEECDELAEEQGASDGWTLATQYASKMLPQIFRPDTPVLQIAFAPEYQHALEQMIDKLPAEVFKASDSLGWVYQFWQAKKKTEVNKSEVKIGADELPAVTQLFTEPYMVSFLLDNSLGAWWAARRLSEDDLENAGSEEELRKKASLPGVPLEYLRFVKGDDGKWTPAAGIFDGWPKHLSELKTLDPCCGSGHFLVAALLMLAPMRMELEGLPAREAVDAVLRDNLHGLEIDQRCVELAAFALALTAWRYPNAGGYRQLPGLNLACSGLSVSVAKEEWKELALDKNNMRIALDLMYDQFKDAAVLGSLLNPANSDAVKIVEWSKLSQMLEQALTQEQTDEKHEMGVVAHGLAKATTLLATKYHWVITNVPYLARGKQSQALKEFCIKSYKEAKNDLATVFLDRCLEFCVKGGTCSVVLPQNWLFLTTYKKFRKKLLINDTWHLIARLGPGAFETISGEVVKAILLTLSHDQSRSGFQPLFTKDKSLKSSSTISGLDVSAPRTAQEKAKQLLTAEIKRVEQGRQLENPDARIILENIILGSVLSDYAYSYQGIKTGDDGRYRHKFWEVQSNDSLWLPFQGTVKTTCSFGGISDVVDWKNDGSHHSRRQGLSAWEKWGASVSQMGQLPASIYFGIPYDSNVSIIVPKNKKHVQAVWIFCSSEEYSVEVRQIDQSMAATNAAMAQVPFDLAHWQKVAAEKYPNGLPKPYSDDPTQWIFHGHPAKSDHPLQVAIARLLGYRWPAELDSEMELSDDQRSWVKKCKALLPYTDDDGIVCIPAVGGEQTAVIRIQEMLAAAYGDKWSPQKLEDLLIDAGYANKGLERWLKDGFFEQHCKLFHQRPFIWHIWDGRNDGFGVLVNYHKLDKARLETLAYTYLGDWISRQKAAHQNGESAAGDRLAAAQGLQKKLQLILEGETPYDIFVRWKPIEVQPVGWNPDLNDGVRLNIRPFMETNIFRKKPKIKWGKDRGKNPPGSPWGEERINDRHLTLDEKMQVQKRKNIKLEDLK